MGSVKAVLSRTDLASEPYWHDKIRIELSECFHFHWRDLRILLNKEQFDALLDAMRVAEHDRPMEYPAKEDIVIKEQQIPGTQIFWNELTVEMQEEGHIHIHYGDMRLELSPSRFLMFARKIEQAKRQLDKMRVVMIRINEIDPYDPGHPEMHTEWMARDMGDYQNHMEGISKVIKGLRAGKKIRPIAVVQQQNPTRPYKRIDGYKRFMAQKQMGRKLIPCYICNPDEDMPGVQDGQSWFLEED